MSAKSQRSPYKHIIVNSHFYHFTQFSQPPTQIKKNESKIAKITPQKQQKTRNDKPHHFEPDSFPLVQLNFFLSKQKKKSIGNERSPHNNQIHNLASSKRFVFDSYTSETMRSKKKNPNLRRPPKERETVQRERERERYVLNVRGRR